MRPIPSSGAAPSSAVSSSSSGRMFPGMSYVACPDCGKKIYLFGEGKSEEAAKRHNLPLLAQMPIDPKLAALVDAGKIEEFEGAWLNAAADALEKTQKRAE